MSENTHRGRRIALLTVVLLLVGVYVSRLIQFQLINGDEFQAQAAAPTKTTVKAAAARGEIYDSQGRPLVINRMGFSLVFQKQYMVADSENQIILTLTELLSAQGEEWNDTLPLVWKEQTEQEIAASAAPEIQFEEGRDQEVSSLKSKIIKINPYATAQNCFDALVKKYKLDEMPDLTVRQQRTIIGVRYEMERREFSYKYPFTLSDDISEETVTKVSENSINTPGVTVQRNPIREYVSGDIAAHVIGTIGPIYAEEYQELKEKGYSYNDVVGKSGIESAMEDQLRGKDGEKTITRDNKGNILEDTVTTPPQAGNSVILSIDSRIQLASQQALQTTITSLQKNNAPGNGGDCRAGAAIVTNVNTGEVVALATYPFYSIEDYKNDYHSLLNNPDKPLLNRATQGAYQPGSAMKPAVALGALQDGTVTGNSVVNCVKKYRFYEDYQPNCMGYHGNENVINALRDSCNYYFFDVGRRLGIDRMNVYSRLLGLGQKTGIEIPEAAGTLAGRELTESRGQTWNPGNTLQAAIGQHDNSFTPIQLANYVSTIANGGTRYQPHLVKSVKSYDMAQTVADEYATVLDQIGVNPEYVGLVQQGMYKVANDPKGTGYRVFSNMEQKIACKTGTAETFTDRKDVSNHSTIISYGPFENPQYSVTVVLENGGVTSFDSNTKTARAIYDALFSTVQNQQQITPETSLLP